MAILCCILRCTRKHAAFNDTRLATSAIFMPHINYRQLGLLF